MSPDSYFWKALDSMPRNEKKPQKEPPATSTEEEVELRLSVTPAAASMEANGNIGPTELFCFVQALDRITD